jgi:hypothetical protein
VGTTLAVLDPRRLSPEGRVDALAAMEKQLSWWKARQSAADRSGRRKS